jgi:hypothetical protein
MRLCNLETPECGEWQSLQSGNRLFRLEQRECVALFAQWPQHEEYN